MLQRNNRNTYFNQTVFLSDISQNYNTIVGLLEICFGFYVIYHVLNQEIQQTYNSTNKKKNHKIIFSICIIINNIINITKKNVTTGVDEMLGGGHTSHYVLVNVMVEI